MAVVGSPLAVVEEGTPGAGGVMAEADSPPVGGSAVAEVESLVAAGGRVGADLEAGGSVVEVEAISVAAVEAILVVAAGGSGEGAAVVNGTVTAGAPEGAAVVKVVVEGGTF